MGTIPSDNRRATILMVLKLVAARSLAIFQTLKASHLDLELSIHAQTSGVCEESIKATLSYPGLVICELKIDMAQLFEPRLSSRKLSNGDLVSSPLEDMTPLLPRTEFEIRNDYSTADRLMTSKNVLLIGAGGDIGNATFVVLSDQGWNVTTINRTSLIWPAKTGYQLCEFRFIVLSLHLPQQQIIQNSSSN